MGQEHIKMAGNSFYVEYARKDLVYVKEPRP